MARLSTKTPAKKPAVAKAVVANATFTKKERFRMVAEAAYFRAERHGFMGDPVQDWIEAENEISMMLNLS